jgi:hypothetical protein
MPMTTHPVSIRRIFGKIAVSAAMLLLAPPGHALPGDLGTTFQVNDQDPLKDIPTPEQRNASPLEFGYYLQDLVARAETSYLHKDWAKAARYYEALARIVPDRAIVFSRLCEVYADLGRADIGVANCNAAVHREGALVADHLRLVSLSLQLPKLSPKDVANVDASLAHLRSHALPAGAPPQGNLALQIELLACRLGVHLRDSKRLDACAASLKKLDADERLLVPFEWSAALINHDEAGASAVLERARALHFPPDSLAAMAGEQKKTFSSGVLGFLKRPGPGGWLGICAAALALAAGIRRILSNAKRRSPAVMNPS